MTRAGIINQIEDLFRSRGLGVYRPSTFPGDPDKNEVLLRGLVEEGLLCSCVDFVDMEHFTLSKEWRTRLMGASENEAELGKGGPEMLKVHGMMKRVEPMEAARPRRIVRWEDDSEGLDEEECYSEGVEGKVLDPFIRIAVAALLILALAGVLLYGLPRVGP